MDNQTSMINNIEKKDKLIAKQTKAIDKLRNKMSKENNILNKL